MQNSISRRGRPSDGKRESEMRNQAEYESLLADEHQLMRELAETDPASAEYGEIHDELQMCRFEINAELAKRYDT